MRACSQGRGGGLDKGNTTTGGPARAFAEDCATKSTTGGPTSAPTTVRHVPLSAMLPPVCTSASRPAGNSTSKVQNSGLRSTPRTLAFPCTMPAGRGRTGAGAGWGRLASSSHWAGNAACLPLAAAWLPGLLGAGHLHTRMACRRTAPGSPKARTQAHCPPVKMLLMERRALPCRSAQLRGPKSRPARGRCSWEALILIRVWSTMKGAMPAFTCPRRAAQQADPAHFEPNPAPPGISILLASLPCSPGPRLRPSPLDPPPASAVGPCSAPSAHSWPAWTLERIFGGVGELTVAGERAVRRPDKLHVRDAGRRAGCVTGAAAGLPNPWVAHEVTGRAIEGRTPRQPPRSTPQGGGRWLGLPRPITEAPCFASACWQRLMASAHLPAGSRSPPPRVRRGGGARPAAAAAADGPPGGARRLRGRRRL